MLQLRDSAASKTIKTESTRFLKTIFMELFEREATEDVMLKCVDRWAMSGTFMNACVKEIVSSPFFIRLVAGLVKQYVH